MAQKTTITIETDCQSQDPQDPEFNPFAKLEEEIKKALEALGDEEKKGIETLAGQVKGQIESLGKSTLAAIEAEAKKVESAILAALASKALQVTLDLINVVAPSDVQLQIAFVTFEISDVHDRIDTLEKWAKSPPTNKDHIKEIIEEIAPSSVSIVLDAALAALFVTSDDLSVGLNMTWDTKDFLDHFDDLLADFNIG